MQKQEKSRKPLMIGIIAAVVILAALLALILVNCAGGKEEPAATTTQPVTTTAAGPEETPGYTLYWNLDREEYDGKSEAGMSSRMPETDGYFHVRFLVDGETVTLRVADRKVINSLDVKDLMGLELDENGIVVGVIPIEELPLEKVAWQFYVQSVGGNVLKLNSSESFAGMEVQLQGNDNTGIYDMTGMSGPKGCEATPISLDRVYAIQNLAGELTHVFIYERPDYMLTHEGHCQHCDETVTWKEWTKEGKLPVTSGHYQLMNDIQLTTQMSFSGQDQKICLDLNGKKVDGKYGYRVYSLHNVGASLAIMDTSEGQTGALIAHGKGDQGMVVWVRYGQFHLYGGTLDASDATTKLFGTAVAVPKNSYMYMHGGTVIGGTATYQQNTQTGKYSRGYGGSIQVTGKLVINDGEIRDGFAQSVTYWSNGSETTTRGYGGNIFVSSGGVVEMNGGTIKNGKAGSNAGNIYLDGSSEFTMNGGTISGGKITGKGKNGGSILVTSKAVFTMNGGTISGGTCYNAGGVMYVNGIFNMNGGSLSGGKCYNYTTKKLNTTSTSYNVFVVNGALNMYGGRIYGGVGVTDTSSTDTKTATVALGGYATIKSSKDGDVNLTINTGGKPKVIVGKMLDGATVGVNTSRGVFTNPTKEENADNFFSDIPEAEILYTEQGLALGRMKCVCGKDTHINGCDGTVHMWAPWILTASAPKTEGNYFLIRDVVTTGQTLVSKGHTVRLDLNGHDITYDVAPTSTDGYRLYRSAFESLLVITDTTDKPGTLRSEMPTAAEVEAAAKEKVEKGTYTQEQADKLIAAQKAGNFGQVLWLRGGDIILHNGIIDGSNLNGSKSGMTIYVSANTASEDGGVTRKGTFTMYGGVIKGATTAGAGAAIQATSNGIVKIHGGIIEGGKSTANAGGNVYVNGEFYMDGGIIRDGVAYSSGGNLTVDGSKANATITGTAQILNGKAGDSTLEKDIGRGGNIRVVTKGAQLTISGNALVSGGQVYRSASSKGGYGGNISINTDTTMFMTGGTVEGGVSQYRGGNIDLCGRLEISGGTITGGKATLGGNIYVLNGTGRELIMTGGTIEKGHATRNGGNINALATVTITGGVIAEGRAIPDDGVSTQSNYGGNIMTYSDLTIGGDAVIRDGYSGGYGGNIAAGVDGSLNGAIEVSGKAQILNGTVDGQHIDGLDAGYGGNFRMAGGTSLVVSGDAYIAGGTAISGKWNAEKGTGGGGQGGNIHMGNARVEILGGIIENGTATGGGGNLSASANNGTMVLQDVIVRNGDTGTSLGGNIRIRGNGIKLLEIKGNTQILGGKASEGGNIHIDGSYASEIRLSGNAYIAGGDAGTSGNGATVYMNKNVTFSMTENAVIDGSDSVGKRGGAIYMGSTTSTFTMDGDTKLLGAKGSVTTHGGVAYLRGEVTIGGNAQLIAQGTASYGAALYYYTGDLTIGGNALIDASAAKAANGSAIYVYQGSATVKVNDSAVIKGGETTGSGATLYMDGGSVLEIAGGEIHGGKTANQGGTIYTIGDILMSGGTIYGGEATGNGGAIRTTKKVTMTGGTIYGGKASYGGAIYLYNGAEMTMSGGLISGGYANSGGNIAVEANANPTAFIMTGGTIEDGEARDNGGNIWAYANKDNQKATVKISNATITGGKANNGGNIIALSGKSLTTKVVQIEISDSTLTGGTAKASGGNIALRRNSESSTTESLYTLTLNKVTLTDGFAGTGSGGNLYMRNAEVTMTETNIVGGMNGKNYTGTDKPNGGNVYVGYDCAFTMNGGSITDGKTINTAGNVYVGRDSVFTMNGGVISGGVRIDSEGKVIGTNISTGNIYLVNGAMVMNGGKVDGGVTVYSAGKLTISGDASMAATEEDAEELFLNATTEPITIQGVLTTDGRFAKVRVSGDKQRVFSTETVAENAAFFTAFAQGEAVILNADNKLELVRYGCICGATDDNHIGDCDGTKHYWTAWTKTDSMPIETGFWFLSGDVTITGKYSGRPAADSDIVVDLNGHTVNYGANNGYRLYTTYNGGHKNNIHITFTDRSADKDGKIVGTNQTQAENGPIVWLSCKGSVLNVYHITIDGTKLATKEGKKGGVISATGSDAQVNLFNATILGGSSENGDALAINNEGATLRLEGDVTITALEGDAIYWVSKLPIDITKLTSLNDGVCIWGEGTFTEGFTGDSVKWFTTTEDRIIEVREGELHLARYHCICDMPDGKHVEGFCDGTKYVWEPWTSTTTAPKNSGYYYLTDDITTSTYNSVTTARTIYIDLNGFDINTSASRLYTTQLSTDRTPAVHFVLTNTNSDDASTIKVTGKGDQGRIVWLSGYNKSLKVYNLTVDVTEATTGVNGLAFSINSQNDTGSASIEVYNTTFNGPTKTSGGVGDVISVTRTTGAGQSLKLKDVTFNGGYGYKTSTDGNVAVSGGALYMAGGTLTMENVTINGAEAGNYGGAVYMGSKAIAVLTGRIDLSGNTDKNGASGIYLEAGAKLDVQDLTDGSVIGITGAEGVISANTYEESDPDLTYLTAENSEQYLIVLDGMLNLKGKTCVCGMPDGKHVAGFCDGTLYAWQPWTDTTKAPDVSGNYFLTADLNVTKTAYIYKDGVKVNLDLNGHSITVQDMGGTAASRLFSTYWDASTDHNVSLTVTNRSADPATIQVVGGGDEGRVIWLTGSNKSAAFYNVSIDMSQAVSRDKEGTTARKDGLGINMGGTGNVLKMYDCKLTGGTTTSTGGFLCVGNSSTATLTRCEAEGFHVKPGYKDGSATSGGYGGFVYVRGTLNLNDCTIKNCSAAKGAGAIYLYGISATNRAKLNMNGGTVEGCAANGDNGGAIDLQAYGDAELTGVTIQNCTTTGMGGAIEVRTGNTMELSKCQIIGCSSTGSAGAIYLNSTTEGSEAKLIMDSCTIDGCTSGAFAGAILAGTTSNNSVTYTSVELNNTTIKNCTSKGRAGAIHVSNGSEAVLTGCTIEGNTDSSRAGAIYSYQGTLTLIDTVVKNNKTTGSSSKGGAIYLYGADITLGGATVITGNTAAGATSNLYLNSRKVIISTEKPLTTGAAIGLDCGAVTVSNNAVYADKAFFSTDKTDYQVIYDGALKVVSSSKHMHCVCGGQPTGDPEHVCKDIEFTAMDALAGGSKLASGNYYLTGDVTVSGTSFVGFEANSTVNFCVAGHTVTGNNQHRVFFAGTDVPGVTFTLTSCGTNDDGTAKGTVKNASQRESNILGFYEPTSVFNLYNVTLDASESSYTGKSWCNVINSKSTFNMYSGTIIGSASSENLAATGNVGVGAGSVMNMYGGTIIGGTCSSTYGTAGNVYVSGTLNMMGGTITGGKIGTNANSYIANMQVIASGKLNMSGGVIDGHVYAGKSGATVILSGDAKILHTGNRGLWTILGNTNLVIGDLSDKAQLEILVKNSSDTDVLGQFATAAENYTLTEQDISRITIITTAGAKRANVVINSDNTLTAVALD